MIKKLSIQQFVCARICRRCKQNFNSNNKFHEHIREHHARKFVENLNFRTFASEFTNDIKKKSTFVCSLVSFIFSFISLHCSVRKHQEFYIQKFYLIVNDLSRMFVEKFKSFDLRQHYNRHFFQQNFDVRQFRSIKFDLIIENLFEMFDRKFRKKNLFQNQNNVFFQISNQMQIIVYFEFTINQKSSISQNSKNSKSKSLNQHMFAKWIRTVFNKNLFEKSINLQYKSTIVFCVKNKFLQILNFSKSKFSKSRIFAKTSFLILVFLHFFSIFFFVFAFVSIISTAKMNCINVYEQIVSIINRVIQYVVSKRNWKKTRNKLFEYSVTKHQKFEFSIFYIQNHVQNQEKISNRLLVCFVYFFCNIKVDILLCIDIIKKFAFFYCDIWHYIKANRNCINVNDSKNYIKTRQNCSIQLLVYIFSNICFETSKISFYNRWFDSHVSWKIQINWFIATSKASFFFAKHRRSIICYVSISHYRLLFVCNQSKSID